MPFGETTSDVVGALEPLAYVAVAGVLSNIKELYDSCHKSSTDSVDI